MSIREEEEEPTTTAARRHTAHGALGIVRVLLPLLFRHGWRIAKGLGRYLVWFGGVTLFALLAAELHTRSEIFFDGAVMDWLHALRSEPLTEAMRAATALGNSEVLAVVAVAASIVLWFGHHWRSGTYVAAAAVGAGLLNSGLKMAFARARPDLSIVSAEGFAFPSGHSMGAAAIYGAIAIVVVTRYPRLRWPLAGACLAVVAAVGLSRAYLGVHYPSDVLAGWALGITWPLWLKPLVLGRGFAPDTVPEAELEADNFAPEESSGSAAQ